jgi:hypothetical protein
MLWVAVALASGCGGEEDGGAGSAARLGLTVETGCGNFLPVPGPGERPRTATVTVFGVDPSQPNHRVIDGTEVTIYAGDAEGRPVPVGGRFASGEADGAPVSAPLAFEDAQATDRFHCTGPGGVLLYAIVGRDITGESVPEYPPGSGETPVIGTPRAEVFAIECLSAEDYAARCR